MLLLIVARGQALPKTPNIGLIGGAPGLRHPDVQSLSLFSFVFFLGELTQRQAVGCQRERWRQRQGEDNRATMLGEHKNPKTRSVLGLTAISPSATLLRQLWLEGLAAGIFGHAAFLVGDARTNCNAAGMAHTSSIVMMAFFNLAVNTPGHRVHPLSLIVTGHSWMIGNHA